MTDLDEYLRAKEIWEKLATDNTGSFLPDVARICVNQGNLYKATGRLKEAEVEYLRAKEIWEKLAEKYPRTYLPGLIGIYSKLVNLYSDELVDKKRAMEMYGEMQGLQVRLAIINHNKG